MSPDPLPPRPPLPVLTSLFGLGAAAAGVAPLLLPAAPDGPPVLLLLLAAALSLPGDLRLRMLAAPAAALALVPPLQQKHEHSVKTAR